MIPDSAITVLIDVKKNGIMTNDKTTKSRFFYCSFLFKTLFVRCQYYSCAIIRRCEEAAVRKGEAKNKALRNEAVCGGVAVV